MTFTKKVPPPDGIIAPVPPENVARGIERRPQAAITRDPKGDREKAAAAEARRKRTVAGSAPPESERRTRNISLGARIRQIAYETHDEETFETKLDAAIRSMWNKVIKNGDVMAAHELFDRGWGKVPQAVNVTLTGTALVDHAENIGLTPADIEKDPLLLAIFTESGVQVVEGEFRVVDIEPIISSP
jgi:hypothetical protein